MQVARLCSCVALSFSLLLVALAPLSPARAVDTRVTVREEPITIPTYLAGDPEPNPMFYFGRGSQGAEGRVYPYPLYDTLTNKKVDKTYNIVYLENEYVRIGVLPEIGGRLFEGVDKTNNYNFFYRQHVIKPALIGLIGAWISGGVEWNIPHHHRASTFIPVQYRTEENARTAARPSGSASWKSAIACAGRWATRCGRASPIWKRRSASSTARQSSTRCCASPTWLSMPTRTTKWSSRPARSSERTTASGSSSTGRSPTRATAGPTSRAAST